MPWLLLSAAFSPRDITSAPPHADAITLRCRQRLYAITLLIIILCLMLRHALLDITAMLLLRYIVAADAVIFAITFSHRRYACRLSPLIRCRCHSPFFISRFDAAIIILFRLFADYAADCFIRH